MPRPKRKSGVRDLSATPHTLSLTARDDIILQLQIDPRVPGARKTIDEMFCYIEKWLGIYFEATIASANLPGPADYRHELSSFERGTSAYLKKIQDCPKWVRDSIDQGNGNIDQLERDIAALLDATATAAKPYLKIECRGRKKNEPRLKLIQELKLVFTKYSAKGEYKASITQTKRDRKRAEQNFVRTIFKDAGIPVPQTLARMLQAR